MITGICWPSPGPSASIDTGVLARTRVCGASHCRFDVDFRHPSPMQLIESVIEAGYEPVPIFDFDYEDPPKVREFIEWADRLICKAELPVIELLNEPRILGGWSGGRYGTFASAVCRKLRKITSVLLAGDYIEANRDGPKIRPHWFEQVRAEVPDGWYDAVALHLYREPGKPEATRYNSRRAEYEVLRRVLPHRADVWVTETGWNIAGVNLEQQAEYLYRELVINEAMGVDAVFVYSALAGSPDVDFGLFNLDLSPRPSAEAVRRFQER